MLFGLHNNIVISVFKRLFKKSEFNLMMELIENKGYQYVGMAFAGLFEVPKI